MSTITVAQFREDFPEFTDGQMYSDNQVQFWINLALTRLNPCRWGDLLGYGIELYTAHNLALAARRAAQAAVPGGIPGMGTGVMASKSVGGASLSYDVGLTTIEGAGTYNLTTYGTEFWQLARQVGTGGLQL